MYQYQPPRSNRIASLLMLAFALLAIILLSMSVALSSFVGLFQLGAVLCLVPEIALYSKYFKRSYIYRISLVKENDAPDLTVSEISGNNSTVVCRLSLDSLISVEKSSKKSRKRLGKHYNYCVEIAPKNVYILRFYECGEHITVILSPDATMLSILNEYASPENDA